TGGSALMPDFVGEAPAANFSPTSTTLLNLVLPVDQPNGSISGKRSLNPSLGGVTSEVRIYTDSYEWLASTPTDSSGDFTFPALPPGTYKVQFAGNVTGPSVPYNYVSRWYQDKPNFDSATVVEVGSLPVTGVNQTLQASGKVRGVFGS